MPKLSEVRIRYTTVKLFRISECSEVNYSENPLEFHPVQDAVATLAAGEVMSALSPPKPVIVCRVVERSVRILGAPV